jgi:hypothetical protein
MLSLRVLPVLRSKYGVEAVAVVRELQVLPEPVVVVVVLIPEKQLP